MYRHVKLFSLLRVTVAYRFKGRRMLLDKLACGAAGNRRQACHLTRFFGVLKSSVYFLPLVRIINGSVTNFL